MGTYVNPGNQAFRRIAGPNYVDKTKLIELFNERIGGDESLICISRPRRFGKSYAAKMLAAYYDRSCDSHSLFDDKLIAKSASYEEHLNQHNVIWLDITGFISDAKAKAESLRDIPLKIEQALWKDLIESGYQPEASDSLNDFFLRIVSRPGEKPFIFIIDEWDAMIREAKDDVVAQKQYLNLLRGWFKNNNFTLKVVAAAYMTGILPIKKDGTQSAISDFKEFSVIKPRRFGDYVGFTEFEVRDLCMKKQIDFNEMKRWYDGYSFKDVGSVYNPNSVMEAIKNNDFDSYWPESTTATELMEYISQDYSGLTRTVAELIGGLDVKVNTNGFANDLTSFSGKDDVLTLLIHLGYLAYNSEQQTVRIPNEEIKKEFQRSIHESGHAATAKRLQESELLFRNTLQKNEEAVAAQIEKIHMEETVPLHYNKEDSLRSVIKLAYYTYRDHYLEFDELATGTGYADVVYYPRPDSDWPVLIIELKWNKDVDGAIDQILRKKYPSALKNCNRPILLVGITYDKEADMKKHSCRIVTYDPL